MVRAAQQRLFGKARHVKATGCAECGFTGFTGRLPLIEFLEITPELRGMITTGKMADEIRAHALRPKAIHTFDNDALWHIAEGDTTADEVIPYHRIRASPDSAVTTRRGSTLNSRPTSMSMASPSPRAFCWRWQKGGSYRFNDILVESRFTPSNRQRWRRRAHWRRIRRMRWSSDSSCLFSTAAKVVPPLARWLDWSTFRS